MSNKELLDLLRKAREGVEGYRSTMQDCPDPYHRQENCTCKIVQRQVEILAQIDAALADANAPTVVVWRTIADEGAFWEAYPDTETSLDAVQYEDGLCRWTASIEREDGGYCNSLAEAKAAAEAAIKRLK
jgi:hypothetical protein